MLAHHRIDDNDHDPKREADQATGDRVALKFGSLVNFPDHSCAPQESADRDGRGQKAGRERPAFEDHPGDEKKLDHAPSVPGTNARVARTMSILRTSNMTKHAQIEVRLRPRGSSDELAAMRDGVLQAKVTAPPVDGKANKALCKLIAKRVGVAPSRVSVVRGEKSRDKVVRVEGVDAERLRAALA